VNTRPTTKAELLSAAEREYTAFRAALEGLDARQLTEVWLGAWSVKEVVAHISGWHWELGPALERMARGERPVPEGMSYNDVDAWNAKFTAAKSAWKIVDQNSAHHGKEHGDQIRAWRAGKGCCGL